MTDIIIPNSPIGSDFVKKEDRFLTVKSIDRLSKIQRAWLTTNRSVLNASILTKFLYVAAVCAERDGIYER